MSECRPSGIGRADDGTAAQVAWRIAPAAVEYEAAVAFMDARAEAIRREGARELVWLLEHPPIYTAGTSADLADLIEPGRFPLHRTGRGGQLTYHGPGQRIAYVMLDLETRGRDIRAYVTALERWLIGTLAAFNVRGETRCGRVGVWVARPQKGAGAEDKIAAIGVRVRRWVTLHGISLNIDPDLEHFSGIVACGIAEHGVTSLLDLGLTTTVHDVDVALRRTFEEVFACTTIEEE